MPKNLVLFSDGTGNSAGKLNKTNVWRVYQAVDLADPQDPQQPRQFSFYDDGVGTSSFKPWALLGGAFGVGLSRNVIDLYVFLCRMYQPGDRIYAFGFSRGAFTIRVLIGLVMSQGLLRYGGSEGELQRLAQDAYRAYRAKKFPSCNPIVGLLRGSRDLILGAWNKMRGRIPYAAAKRIGVPGLPDAVEIQFVGLWDTVDAYGLPVDELTRAIDACIWPLTMRDYNLNPRVLCARHALALDDERNTFHPRLWNEVPVAGRPGTGVEGANRDTRHVDEERISQVWFAGVHSNVGGGYPDDGLSYVSLEWIMREAEKHGLRFEDSIWEQQTALSDENGPLYDSRRGMAGYYRYNPRRIERLVDTSKVRIARTKVHESVLRRIQAGHDGYAPIALPPGFAVMRIDGGIVDGEAYLRSMTRLNGSPPDPVQAQADAARMARPLLVPPAPYVASRETVFNTVWRRRIAYFATLALTLVLLAMPLYLPGTQACAGSSLCFLMAPIQALGFLLPSFATTWTDSFSSHPWLSLPLAIALLVGVRWGGSLEAKIRDQMRRVWYEMPVLKPTSATSMPAPGAPGLLDRAVERMRNHPWYVAAFRMLTHRLLPLAFLLGIGYGAAAVGSRLTYAWQSSGGHVCTGRVEPGQAAGIAGRGWFDLRSECWPAGLDVVRGATYRVTLSVPISYGWNDGGSIPAGPNGFTCRLPLADAVQMAGAVPLRRHLTEPWFQPMARIGRTGNDSHALRGDPATAPERGLCEENAPQKEKEVRKPSSKARCPSPGDAHVPMSETFETRFVARSDGPLFLYVNDAVRVPFLPPFYDNNLGCARVEVTRIVPEPSSRAPNGAH